MPDEVKKRHARTRLWVGVAISGVLLAIAAALGWYLRSPQFEDLVRRKLVATLEDATGGRVELTSFHWNLSQLAFEADGLTIHGLEGADQLPYAHVDRALVRLHIISFVERQISLEQVELQRPVVHIIVHPDGSTNAPEPKIKSTKSPVQELFDLAIARADFHDGMLLLNQRQVPLDFSADDITAAMSYNRVAQRYDGSVHVGKMDARYQDFRDVPAQAKLQFSLWHNMVEIKELKLTSERSSFQASGKVTDFTHPQVQVTYSGTLGAAQLGAVTRIYQLRGGTMLLDGTANYSEPAGHAARGRIALRDLDYLDSGIVLHNANLDSNFSLDNNHLVLTRIAARLLGGQVTGDADIKNLTSGTSASTPGGPVATTGKRSSNLRLTNPRVTSQTAGKNGPAMQEGSARLRVSGLSLAELARMMSSSSLPVDKLNLTGNVAGAVNLSWKRSLNDLFADLALDVAAPAQAANNQLPVNGSLRGRHNVRSGVIDLAALSLTTPHTHLEATGTLGPTSVALQLAINTTSLTEFQPLLAAMGSAPLPVELAGAASFSGTLNDRLRSPRIAGHLQATNFTYLYVRTPKSAGASKAESQTSAKRKSWFHLGSAPQPPTPPQPATQPRRIHIDQFSGDVQYSQSAVALHHAVIDEAGAQLNVDGMTTLDKGNFTENSQFQVQAAMHNADIAAWQRAAGFDYPVAGKLNLTIQAAGTQADPHGHGQISLTEAQAYGRPIKSLTSNIVFASRTARLEDVHLQAGRGVVEGWAAYDFSNNGLKFDLSGQSIDLAEVPEVQTPHLQVAGVASFTAKGAGTLAQPVINGHLQIRKLILNGEPIGALEADAVTHGRQLQLTARSNFSKATLSLDGSIDLQGMMPAKLNLQFSNLDINPFLPADLRSRVTQHASLNGQAQLSGPLKQPMLLSGSLSVREFSVEIESIALKSDGPVELSFASQVVTVQRCTLVSEDTRFSLSGSASLKDDRRLDLHASGHLNLKLAQSLSPDLTSYGASNVDLTIGGTASNPVMSGRVDIVHAGLSMIDLPAGLGDVNGRLVFSKDRLQVERLTGRMGGGQVTLAGFVTFGRTLGFNLTSSGREIRFRYAGISVTSDQELRLTGTLQNSTLSGNITVTRFAQIPSSDLQFMLAQASAPATIPNGKSPLNNLHLDVRIVSTPELTVQTTLAKLSGDVDLRLRGTGERPVLLGRINIAEGDIKLGGTKYHLERGDVTFLDPVRIDPVLDVEATTRVRDYDITIGLHGTMERLNTTYRSDPPLSSDDIVSLLAFGRTQQESAAGTSPSPGFADSASGAILGAAINQAASNRVSKIFGVSSIRINPSVGGPDNDPNARLTLEQQVSNNITLTYITNLARSAQEVIQFEYNINSEYTVQGIRDENGVVSFDLLIRKRKR
jgi:translocation and assembly module TamB